MSKHEDFALQRRPRPDLGTTLLSEISLPKLVAALILMLVAPCFLLGLSPLIASAWVAKIPGPFTSPYAELWPIVVLAPLLAVGCFDCEVR